jgi:hypothetical protein
MKVVEAPVPGRQDLLGALASDFDGRARPSVRRSTDRPDRPMATPGAPAVRLPEPSRPVVPVGRAVGERQAVRFYSSEPVEPADLHAMLREGLAADLAGWPGANADGLALTLLVVASRVTSVPRGIYEYAGDTLRLVAPLEVPEQMEPLVLQREFAWAPVIIVAVGPLGRALARDGSHGYRALLARAGGLVHAGWMAGVRRGLVGCAFAGLLPYVLRERAGVDGYRSAPLFAFAVGRPFVATSPGRAVGNRTGG